MHPLKVCRICLSTDLKLYEYSCYDLKNIYEQVIGSKINKRDGLPVHFCYECAALLHKFHKFKEKSHRGQDVFKQLLQKGPVTLKSLTAIRRQTMQLQSSLNIITVSHRVKTFKTQSKEKLILNKTHAVDNDIEIASISDYDDDTDTEVENDISPPSPELVHIDTKIEDDNDKVFDDDVNIEELKVEKEENVSENEMIDSDSEHFESELENSDNKLNVDKEKKESVESLLEAESVFAENDVLNEEEKLFANETNICHMGFEEIIEKEPLHINVNKKKKSQGSKKKKEKDNKTDRKAKKFENNDKKKTGLDSKNWLKFNLSEEEALEEFKARALHKRYLTAEYKCNDCLKGFSKEDMLIRHMKLRHADSLGPIECRFCHMRFKWKCFLRKHMRQHYTKFKCLRCDLVCPLETSAMFHEDYHNGVIRKCEHCDEEFKHLTTYYTHLRTHRSEHVCALCGASFVSAIGLKIHKTIKHIDMDAAETQDGIQGHEEYCIRCDIKFETRKAFEEHLIHSAKHVDGFEDTKMNGLPAATPRKMRHNAQRLKRIPTNCNICGKHYSTQAACRRHHLAEHPRTSFFAPNERHICEICGMSLAPGSVASHRNTHTREKMYSCSTCSRQFSSKGAMIQHQLTHTSEKPVACTLCDKRFKQSSSMKLHFRTFHLKEPYPKRNRKKKSEDLATQEIYAHEESDDNLTLDRWR